MSSVMTRPGVDRIGANPDVAVKTGVAVLPALLTVAAGVLVPFCVGFLQTSAVHNSTHGTRHANGFPCH